MGDDTIAPRLAPAVLFSLEGRRALVTGGGRGLGRTMAWGLAAAGADVALLARSAHELEETAAGVRELGRRAATVVGDLLRIGEIAGYVARAAEALGGLDILVNNAGINIPRPALEVTEADWDTVVDLNLKALFFCSQAAGRIMVAQRRGAIVNIASQMAFVGWHDRAAYCASKGGVAQLTRVLAVEWARHNVRVNAIAPTFFETPQTAPMFARPGFREAVLDKLPVGRVGQPEELVGAVVYLASDAASMVTGTTLLVDGGWTAW